MFNVRMREAHTIYALVASYAGQKHDVVAQPSVRARSPSYCAEGDL